MTQPGPTKLVQEMEEMFKARLFERGKMGTEPSAQCASDKQGFVRHLSAYRRLVG
ncbi:helix-turn-helix domain-containing protein [Paraburkholderia rhynchosiae]|uniref:HTH lysR-type domain-containing protein n=1 Tax=Paraburkholderia rhynchosiae TaxID=487049 RepID=A0A6J5B4R2_9BURK|nr:LysR family transcriptional regulator [Paraburkholderia rhynchosiae]CAB3691105.1 hypothetical protein LMG27174_03173 [Paraburkholderia rhynchosiae]